MGEVTNIQKESSMKTILKTCVIIALLMSASKSEAQQAISPYVIHSSVVIILKPTSTGVVPSIFEYKINHLGQVMAQGNVSLGVSIPSLIAATNIYSLAQTNVCNSVSQIFQTPDGSPIQVYRKNSYFIPPNTRWLASESLTDC